MSVSVIIPWRAGCLHREAALAWVLARWHTRCPSWQVQVSVHEGGPWSKGAAVGAAVPLCRGRVVVIADGDVWTDGVADAVAAVEAGEAGWAIPHRQVYRLTHAATAEILAGVEPYAGMPTTRDPYPGVPSGGVVVQTAEVLEQVPVDPRFHGWGQEDESRGWWALPVLAGPPWVGSGPLWHLWHPPAARLDERRGSQKGMELYLRYQSAGQEPPDRRVEAMRALVAEARCAVRSQDTI